MEQPLDLWKTKKINENDLNSVEDSKFRPKSLNDFSKILHYWPTSSEKWKCIASAMFSTAGTPVGVLALGVAMRRRFSVHSIPFQLFTTGYMSAILLLPAAAFHYKFIMLPMATKTNVCPLCLEIRQISINLLLGCALPAVVLPFAFLAALDSRQVIRKMSMSHYLKYLLTEMKPILKRDLPLVASICSSTGAVGIFFEHKYVMRIVEIIDFEPEIIEEINERASAKKSTRYGLFVFLRNLKEKIFG